MSSPGVLGGSVEASRQGVLEDSVEASHLGVLEGSVEASHLGVLGGPVEVVPPEDLERLLHPYWDDQKVSGDSPHAMGVPHVTVKIKLTNLEKFRQRIMDQYKTCGDVPPKRSWGRGGCRRPRKIWDIEGIKSLCCDSTEFVGDEQQWKEELQKIWESATEDKDLHVLSTDDEFVKAEEFIRENSEGNFPTYEVQDIVNKIEVEREMEKRMQKKQGAAGGKFVVHVPSEKLWTMMVILENAWDDGLHRSRNLSPPPKSILDGAITSVLKKSVEAKLMNKSQMNGEEGKSLREKTHAFLAKNPNQNGIYKARDFLIRNILDLPGLPDHTPASEAAMNDSLPGASDTEVLPGETTPDDAAEMLDDSIPVAPDEERKREELGLLEEEQRRRCRPVGAPSSTGGQAPATSGWRPETMRSISKESPLSQGPYTDWLQVRNPKRRTGVPLPPSPLPPKPSELLKAEEAVGYLDYVQRGRIDGGGKTLKNRKKKKRSNKKTKKKKSRLNSNKRKTRKKKKKSK